MFTLARETGWSEAFILWQLPLVRLLQYHHCALRAADVWTIAPRPSPAAQLAALEAFVAGDNGPGQDDVAAEGRDDLY